MLWGICRSNPPRESHHLQRVAPFEGEKIYGFKVIVEAYRFERLTVHIRRLPQDS